MTDSKACALIITSDAELGKHIHELLSSVHIDTTLSETVQQAAHSLKMQFFPQIIILDWLLPRDLTTRFLQQIRGLKRFAQLPILVIVDEPDPQAVKAALEAGANRYLTQSFIQTNLIRTLREMHVKAF